MDSRTKSIQGILGLMQKNLECSICLDLLTNPVSTKCDHPFCRFCITEFLKTKTSVPCPLCKCPITKRSLNDRPQLSHIVENVRLLLGAFSKDTGYQYSPPRETSSADFLSCTPEQLPHKEVKGTKRKLPVSDKKKLGRSNVRQSKRRRSDVALEVTEAGDSDRQTDKVWADLPSDISTATENRPVICKLNQEDSVTNQILSCLRSGSDGVLVSANGDTSQTNLSVPVSRTRGKLRETKDRNLFDSFPETVQSERHLRPKDKKNYSEDDPTLETFDEDQTESQGHSEANSMPESTPRVAMVTRTYDKQFVNSRDTRGTFKVKEWLTSNLGRWKGQGHNQGTSDMVDTNSVVENDTEEVQRDDLQLDGLENDSSKPEEAHSLDEGPVETNSHHLHNETAKPPHYLSKEVLQKDKLRTASTENRNQGSRKIFKSTRNNQQMETSVKQKKGKFLFKKIKPRAVSGISSDQVKAVESLECVKSSVDASKANLKLRELNLNTFGNESDPYEFKSSQVTPVKPKVLKRQKKMDKRKKGQVNVEIQNMLNRKSEKSILKKMTMNGMEVNNEAKGGKEDTSSDRGKKKKLSPKVIQKQMEEEVALREMQDKISQAEEYDLVTSTQEVLDHLTEEEKGTEEVAVKNKKYVSFNQDVVFFSSQDQRRVKCLKETSESPESTKDCWNGKEREVSAEKETGGGRGIENVFTGKIGLTSDQESENLEDCAMVEESENLKDCVVVKKSENLEDCVVVEESENLEGVSHEGDMSSKRKKDDVGVISPEDDDVEVISLENDDIGVISFEDDVGVISHEDDDVGVISHEDDDVGVISLENDYIGVISLEDDVGVISHEDDDGNSSSTTDLDIQPDESEFAVPDLDIQPKEILEKLNSQDFNPYNVANEKNSMDHCGSVEEVDVVPDSEDRIQGRKAPIKLNLKSSRQKTRRMKESLESKMEDGGNYEVVICENRKVKDRNEESEDRMMHAADAVKEPDRDGSIQTNDYPKRRVPSGDVIPETPLITTDRELTAEVSSCSSQERTLTRKNRLKRSPKLWKESRVEIACEETQVNNVFSEETSPARVKEVSETVVSSSPGRKTSQGCEDGCSGTVSTQLSSETQDSQSSLGRRLRKYHKRPSYRKDASYVVPRTPMLEEAKTIDGSSTDCLAGTVKQNLDGGASSQLSLSSLCSTQESVSMLLPVHRTVDITEEKQSSISQNLNMNSECLLNNHSEKKKFNESNGQKKSCEEIIEVLSQGANEDLVVKESQVESTKSLTTFRVSNRLSRPKRKCFSLVSPEKGLQKELHGRNVVSVKGDEELTEQNTNPELKAEQSKEVPEVSDVETERRQAVPESSHSGIQLSGDIKSTPSEALIPTQLSLNSIKKKEVKWRKQQSSPEDVFLMDSETPGSGSCYEDLVQNQEGLLDLELGDMEDVCGQDVDDSQVNSSCSKKESGMVGDARDRVNDLQGISDKTNRSCTRNQKMEDSRDEESVQDNYHNRETKKRSDESQTILTIPDSKKDGEELLVDQGKLNIDNARDLPAEKVHVEVMEERDSWSKSGSHEKSESLSGSEVITTGRSAVRGLARKLKQKNLNDNHLNRDDSIGKPSTASQKNKSNVLLTVSEKTGRNKARRDSRAKDNTTEESEDPQENGAVCKTVVPETVDIGVEELEFNDDVTAVPETMEDDVAGEEEHWNVDKEVSMAGEEDQDLEEEDGVAGVENQDVEEENSMAVREEDQGVEEEVDIKDKIFDENTLDEDLTCIQESVDKRDTQKGTHKQESSFLVKESELLIDDTQEFQGMNLDNLVSRPKQETRQDGVNGEIAVGDLETQMEDGGYMATAADDEPLFNSPESSPLPHILEEECGIPQENPSAYKNAGKSKVRENFGKLEVRENVNGSDSSGFELLPEDTLPDPGHQNTRDGAGNNADFVEIWEGKNHRKQNCASEKRCRKGKGCDDLYNDKKRWENFIDLSDDDDEEEITADNKLIGTRRNPIKKGEVHDDDEEEVIRRKKTKRALIISDDEEDETEIKTLDTSRVSNEEDSDMSQESLASRQMNLTSSSAFTSQSEGFNTQNEVLLRQELERMKKEMAEIESRIQKGHSTLIEKNPCSPGLSPEVTEEPYSQYLKELQDEESDDDFPHQSQNSVCKMADKVETYHSEDSSDLFLSPPPPSPPPSDGLATTGIEVEFPEHFQETKDLLQQFGSGKKILPGNEGLGIETGRRAGSENVVDDGEDCLLEMEDEKWPTEFMDPCRIAESPCNADNNKRKQSGTSQREHMVVQESPQSQKSGKRSLERLKDLYHSTPVANRHQSGRKNTLSFLSPVVTSKELSESPQIGTKASSSGNVRSPFLHNSLGTSNQSKVFIASGLPLSQLNELRRLIQSHDNKFHSKFTPNTTHLIVKTVPPGCRMCERTLKFFQALACKCWILDYLWVTDSLAAGRLLEEGPYEITADTVTNVHHYGPRKSRTRSPTDPGILERIQFHIIGSSQSLNPDDIRDLVETSGGLVVRDPEEFKHSQICLIITCADLEDSQETLPSQEIILYNRLYRRYKAVTVSREWLLDSLTVQELQPLNDYVLTSVKGMVIPAL